MKCLKNTAFTLVELMVVVTVVVILALISYVGYDTVVDNAISTKIAANLDNVYKKIREYHTENRVYPQSITDCPTPASTNICIDTGTTEYEYTYNNSTSPKTFSVIASENNSQFRVKNDSPVSAYTSLTWTSMTMYYHMCGIASDGYAYCWGWGQNGGLGNNLELDFNYPVAVDRTGVLAGKTMIKLASSEWSACGIASDNNAYCWGDNYWGKLGDNIHPVDSEGTLTPVAVYRDGALSGKTVKDIDGEYSGYCVIASDDRPYCWGRSYLNGSASSLNYPNAINMTGVLAGKTVKAITVGGYAHACVIASDNYAYCWGWAGYGTESSLGHNLTTSSLVPVAVDRTGVLAGKTIKSIDAGYFNACVIASDDKVYCWGSGYSGQLGNNSTADTLAPVAVDMTGVLSGKTIKSISVGDGSTCAIASDDKLYCWGESYKGDGNALSTSLVPVAAGTAGLLADKTIKKVIAENWGENICVIASDDQMYCWGEVNQGILGNDTTTTSLVPVRVRQP